MATSSLLGVSTRRVDKLIEQLGIIRLIGAVLAEQTDEWIEARR